MDESRNIIPTKDAVCPNASMPRVVPFSPILCILMLFGLTSLKAQVQFDVFLGFGQNVPSANWFPVVFEVFNPGPSFTGTIQVAPGSFSDSRSLVTELPTGTRKRFVIPVFSPANYHGQWNARLLDERRKVRAEMLNIRGAPVHWQVPLMASLTGKAPPTFPELSKSNSRRPELEPRAARMLADTFPDNPISLAGMDSLYISSGMALENSLNQRQVQAILGWVFSGGHLILTVEQPTHVNGTEWLRKLIPCTITDKRPQTDHSGIHKWVSSTRRVDGLHYRFGNPQSRHSNPYAELETDAEFESQPMEVSICSQIEGSVIAGTEEEPLIVTAPRGRGRVTVLLFEPENEPFRSWKHRTLFWAKMAEVPPELLTDSNFDHYSGYSVEGVVGAMIDSRQVRKLPVTMLILLLVVYLAVIGPVDRFVLKKINRQMLTWITFPLYVVMFSGLIYVIGYKLRAGDREWNELHFVDVVPLPSGEGADIRGRTYASVYSPANATYPVSSDQSLATFRGELLGGRAVEGSSAKVTQKSDSFTGQISVPIWTSQLFVSDWARQQQNPLMCSVKKMGDQYQLGVTNLVGRDLDFVKLVVDGKVFDVQSLENGAALSLTLTESGTSLEQFVRQHTDSFLKAHRSRRKAFGGNTSEIIDDIPAASMALSFQQTDDSSNGNRFISPSGFDLTSLADSQHAILLAWASDYGPTKELNDFNVSRKARNSLFRIAIPVQYE